MFDIKNSVILDKVIKAAKCISSNTTTLTAENFLAALIDTVRSTEDNNSEIIEVKKIFNDYGMDPVLSRSIMLSYLDGKSFNLVMDSIYMQKKLYEAKGIAAKQKMSELKADVLLLCIFKEPSSTIKSVIAGDTDSPVPEKIGPVIEISDKDEDDSDLILEDEIETDVKDSAPPKKADATTAKDELGNLVADVKAIREELQNTVFGQDNAINVFTTGYFQSRMLSMMDKSRKRPLATFLFAGPPGVGKTFLAEKSAELLKLPFKRFDMSEYSHRESAMELCGFDKVYKDAKSGVLTSFVEENPQCVLLFDEIEKANISVIHLFLQILDAARLRDNNTEREVSFTNSIIIFTTNAGKQLYEDSETGDFSTLSRKVIIKALQKDVNPETNVPFFPGAICSRFASGNVVMFNHIGAHNLRAIAKKEIERHANNFQNQTGIKLSINELVYTALLFSEGGAADARAIRGRAENFFNDELYELLRLIDSSKVKTNISNIEKISINVDLSHTKKEITELFIAEDKTNVLVFADLETVELCNVNASKFNLIGVQTVNEGINVMQNKNIDFVLLDLKYGASISTLESLNIEDVESPARDFFKFLKEKRAGLPVYLIEERGEGLNEEEKISFMRQGVRGVLRISKSKNAFAKELNTIAANLYQQSSMNRLAKENKLISFGTAQTVSKNGKNAEIKLFDFEMAVALDPEDAKSVLSSMSKPNVHFDDVIGARDAKKELKYFVEYLKNPKKYMGTGVKAPKGVILYGPPGTGKTMLAKAMACEAGVTFIAAEGNQFLKSLVGEGSKTVHDLFKTARKYAPSILFIDEIDAIAKERKGGANSGSYGEDTLTAFLTEMDGFANDPSKPVFVLAATNFDVEPGGDKSLDPALMRRFDRRVYIELPNKEERIQFLKNKVSKNKALDISELEIENIAMRAIGSSLAELDSIIELALRSAIRENSTVVTDSILEEAFETFNNGETKKWDSALLERVARHEAGHALLYWLGGETPSYLTVVARGNHGGYMQHAEQEGKAIYTKDELLSLIRTSLGGRAAEIVYYGERDGISTGAAGDLVSATNNAMRIVCSYGMDNDFGLAVVNNTAAGNMSAEIMERVNSILSEQMVEAIRLITENKDKIDSLVEELMAKNYLNSTEIEQAITKKQ